MGTAVSGTVSISGWMQLFSVQKAESGHQSCMAIEMLYVGRENTPNLRMSYAWSKN